MTYRLSDKREVISLEDLALAQRALDLIWKLPGGRTYDFNITSDTQLRKGRHIV